MKKKRSPFAFAKKTRLWKRAKKTFVAPRASPATHERRSELFAQHGLPYTPAMGNYLDKLHFFKLHKVNLNGKPSGLTRLLRKEMTPAVFEPLFMSGRLSPEDIKRQLRWTYSDALFYKETRVGKLAAAAAGAAAVGYAGRVAKDGVTMAYDPAQYARQNKTALQTSWNTHNKYNPDWDPSTAYATRAS